MIIKHLKVSLSVLAFFCSFSHALAQPYLPKLKLDILWVVDDSGSMADHQDLLGRNFDAFIEEFLAKDVDFRMAVTTTDDEEYYAGRMVGDWRKLTSEAALKDEAKFLDDFWNTVMVGTIGSVTEKGLASAKLFLEKYRSEWLRDDAYLVIMVLTDEEEQSAQSADFYYRYFTGLKLHPNFFQLNSITAFHDSDNWYSDQSRGQKYMDVAELSGGAALNIEEDYWHNLTQAKESVMKLISE